MTDLRRTIEPKTDQLNSDSLIGGPLTIRVTKVSLCKEAEQPIAINFEGDDNKPYKPCKSMRRVLVQVWGSDGNAFAGRRMVLYRDPNIKFGGLAVGGIRISHMSDLEKPVTMALTESRASRKPFVVQPLQDVPPTLLDPARTAAGNGLAAYEAHFKGLPKPDQKALLPEHEALKAMARAVDNPETKPTETNGTRGTEAASDTADAEVPFGDGGAVDDFPGTVSRDV